MIIYTFSYAPTQMIDAIVRGRRTNIDAIVIDAQLPPWNIIQVLGCGIIICKAK